MIQRQEHNTCCREIDSKAGNVSSHPKMAVGVEMNPELQLSLGQSRKSDRFITTLPSDFMVSKKKKKKKSIYSSKIHLSRGNSMAT